GQEDCDGDGFGDPCDPEGDIDLDGDGVCEHFPGCDLLVPIIAPSIQEAIEMAEEGDFICVFPGRYHERIDFQGKTLVLRGIEGASETVIEGAGTGSVVRFTQGEGPETRLEGFTITGGFSLEKGAGIWIEDASPTLRNLIVTGNRINIESMYPTGGAGIYMENTSSLLEDLVIEDNGQELPYICDYDTMTIDGGGIYISDASVHLRNVTIAENFAGSGCGDFENAVDGGDGGGIFMRNSTAIFEDVIVERNRSGDGDSGTMFSGYGGNGGGIYLSYSSATFRNVDFLGNQAGEGGSVFGDGDHTSSGSSAGSGGAIHAYNTTVVMENVRFIGNSTGNGGSGGSGYTVATAGGSGGMGGAIYVKGDEGVLSITNGIMTGNWTGDGGDSGVVGDCGNDYPIEDGKQGANGGDGGAIYAEDGEVTLENVTFHGNHTGMGGEGGAVLPPARDVANGGDGGDGGSGAAIYRKGGTSLNLINVTFSGNFTGAGGPGGGVSHSCGG
ncbi:MAG: hypothetical protein D6795_20790, partial [Deltaproteobacteria bacterium]